MDNIGRVLFNLVLYSAVLYAGIKVISLIFDKGTNKFMKLDKKNRSLLGLAFVLLAALVPVILANDTYALRTATMVLVYIVLALSLNFVIGFAGQLSMGHAAFYAVGAYTTAILTTTFGVQFWIALLCSGVMAAIFGVLLGIPTLRLKGDYLAITTIGFSEILRLVLVNWTSLTRGPAGIPGIPSPTFFGITLGSNTAFYYILLVLVLITVVISSRLLDSRLGRGLLAIRDDETAAEAMGINPTFLKILAFVLAATLAGLVGGIFASFIQYVNPDNFVYSESVVILTMVVLGGIGSIPGVIVGAIVLTILPEALRDISTYRYAIYGILLIMMMIVRPQGIISSSSIRPNIKSNVKADITAKVQGGGKN